MRATARMINTAIIIDKTAATIGCQSGTFPTVNLVIIMIGADRGKMLKATAKGEWGLMASMIENT